MKATMKFAAIAAIALGAATMTSCNKGGDEPARDEVKIFTSVSGMTRAPQLDATGEGVFSTGDTFALLVQGYNEEYKRFDYAVGETKLYWDQMPASPEDYTYFFHAMYPNLPEFNAEDRVVDFNVATAANPDLLIAYADGIEKNDAVQLTFRHAMHKLNVKLTSNFFTDGELATARVCPSLKSTANVNAWHGAYPEGASGNEGEYPVKEGASTSWIVAPQKLPAEGMLLLIWVGEYYLNYDIPASLSQAVLKGGEVTTLTLNLHRDAVSLEGKDVSQWGTETEVPGTIPVIE